MLTPIDATSKLYWHIQLPKALAFTRNPSDPTVTPATYTAEGASDLFLTNQQRDIAIDGSEEDDVVSVSTALFGLGLETPALYNYNVRGFAGDDEIGISTSLLQDSVINGNEGADVMFLEANDMAGSYFLGGKGNDEISADSFFLRDSLKNGEVNGNIGDDQITIGGGGTSSFEDIYVGGGQGNDLVAITGDFEDSIVDGNKGSDTIEVGFGDHTNSSVNGGEGNDIIRTLNFGTTGLNLNGDLGNDTIVAIGGIQTTVTGGEGNDTIALGGIASTLNTVDGGVGADFVALEGGESRETYIFNRGDSVAATETSFAGTPGVGAELVDGSTITFEDGVDQLTGTGIGDLIEIDFSADFLANINDDNLIDTTLSNSIYEVEGSLSGDVFTVGSGEDTDNYMYIIGGENLTVGQVFTNSSNIIITDERYELIGGDLVSTFTAP